MYFTNIKWIFLLVDILSYIPENDMSSVIQNLSSWIDHTGDMEDSFHGNKIRCYAHIVKGGMCVRTNTVATYCEINKQVNVMHISTSVFIYVILGMLMECARMFYVINSNN